MCNIRSSASRLQAIRIALARSSKSPRLADIPAGTGLGSSGSFTTALLRALHAHARSMCTPRELAELACHIEIDRLGEPIGKQDQYIAAFGGVTCLLPQDGAVDAAPLAIDDETRHTLEDNLLLFFTGFSRSASAILKEQDQRTMRNDSAMIDNLHSVKDLGLRSKAASKPGIWWIRPVDARALGAQAAALGRHEEPTDRRVV